MLAIDVNNLTKQYPSFLLDVSFSIKRGNITGLIGRNGAGKSTTLKGIMNLIRTEGEIKYFGEDFRANESSLKQRIGYVSGGFDFYKQKTLAKIAKTVATFYSDWDEVIYRKYMERIGLDENKKVFELSEGMKVKFSIVLALSHKAELLIMDEPTSGLDPLSREELCGIILELNNEDEISVLFSTHITSDLERIADEVIYISDGRIVFQESLDSLMSKYGVVDFETEEDAKAYNGKLIGLKRTKHGYTALTYAQSGAHTATLDDIMIHFEKEKEGAND